MQRIINILLIEDDQLDQMEVARTLSKKGILHRLKIAKNGEDAMRAMQEETSDSFIGKPDLILLDINMPKVNGFEVLSMLKSNEEWRDIKVFILTTSEEKEDKLNAQNLGASGFITKPLKLEGQSTIDAFNLMIDLMNLQVK